MGNGDDNWSSAERGEPGPPPPPSGPQAATQVAPPPPRNKATPRDDIPTTGRREIAAVLLAGFFGNLILRTGLPATLAGTLVVLTLVVVLVAERRVRRGPALLYLVLAGVLSLWLSIRSNPALTAANVAAIIVLLGVSTGWSLRGSALDARVRDIAGHVVAPVYEWLYGLRIIEQFARSGGRHSSFLRSALRGLVVAAPVIMVFGALLAAADQVFASLLPLDDAPNLVSHVLASVLVAVILFGWVSRAAHLTPESEHAMNFRILGPVEITIILGSLVALFVAFVITQVVVALGGADHVLVTEGLTQAEHARRGFFQLLWVAGLSLTLVGGLRSLRTLDDGDGRDRFVPLALTTLALTLVIAAISLQRLGLYVGSFGLTPLRFWAMAGAVGVGLLVLLYSFSISGRRSEAMWFPGVAIVVASLFVIGLNVVDPDRTIAAYNLGREPSTALDVELLGALSDDAVETLIDGLGTMDPEAAARLTVDLCDRPVLDTEYGLLDFNRSRASADRLLAGLCQDDRR